MFKRTTKEQVRKFISIKSKTFAILTIVTFSLNFLSKGGGSASDSGRSIASSVSTEPFFTGQSVTTEPQAATETAPQNQTQTAIESSNTANNNGQVQSTPNAVAETSTSQVLETQPEDTNESQDTNESKEPETATNADNADIVINVYSSGDEGKFVNGLF